MPENAWGLGVREGRDAKVHSPEADAGEPSEKSQACRGQERAPLKSAFGALAAARLWGRRGFEPRRASPLLKAQSRLALENFGKNSRPDPPKLQHVRSPRQNPETRLALGTLSARGTFGAAGDFRPLSAEPPLIFPAQVGARNFTFGAAAACGPRASEPPLTFPAQVGAGNPGGSCFVDAGDSVTLFWPSSDPPDIASRRAEWPFPVSAASPKCFFRCFMLVRGRSRFSFMKHLFSQAEFCRAASKLPTPIQRSPPGRDGAQQSGFGNAGKAAKSGSARRRPRLD